MKTDVRVSMARLPFLNDRRALAHVSISVEASHASRQPATLVVLLDRSSSMRGARLHHALDALESMLAHLRSNDRLGLISFDAHAEVTFPPSALDDEARAFMGEKLEATVPGRGTNLGAALALLTPLAKRERARGGVLRAIVLTDGFPSVGPLTQAELATIARPAVRLGATISCVGVGADYDATLLRPLAEVSGGRLYNLLDAGDISEVLRVEVDGLTRAALSDVTIDLLPAPSVERVQLLHTLRSERLFDGLRVSLGEVSAHAPRSVLFGLDARDVGGVIRLRGKNSDGVDVLFEEQPLRLSDDPGVVRKLSHEWLSLELANALVEGWEALSAGSHAARCRFRAGLALATAAEQVLGGEPHPLASRLRLALIRLDEDSDLARLRSLRNAQVVEACETRISRVASWGQP